MRLLPECGPVRSVILSLVLCGVAAAMPCVASGEDAAELPLLFTGDVLGSFEPCRCDDQPFGGIAQRAFAVSEQRQAHPDLLVLDAGNLLFRSLIAIGSDADAWRKVAALVLVDAYSLMDVDAVNVGPHDLAAGLDYLERLQRRATFPFLSTNLLDAETGVPIFTPVLTVDRDDTKVAIIGLLPGEMEGRGYSTSDPVKTARDAARKAREQGAEQVVALSSLGLDESARLARRVRDLDVVLVAGDRMRTDPPRSARDTLLVSSGSRGKYLVVLSGDEIRFVPVERGAPVDEEVEQLVLEAAVRYRSPDFIEAGPKAIP